MNKVKKNQLNRFTILEVLYNSETSNGILDIKTPEFLDKCNMTKSEIYEAIEFLKEKNLIEDYGEASYSIAKINSYGKEEYEKLLSAPEKPGDYLSPIINYINIETMQDSQILQGNSVSSKNRYDKNGNGKNFDLSKVSKDLSMSKSQISILLIDIEFLINRITKFKDKKFVNTDDPLLKDFIDDYEKCKKDLIFLSPNHFEFFKNIELGEKYTNNFVSEKSFYVKSNFEMIENELAKAQSILNMLKESDILSEEYNQNEKKSLTPFISISFNDKDKELNQYFKNILDVLNIDYITGEKYSIDSIPDKVKNRIKEADLLIIIFVKREELKVGGYTTPGWLLKELGFAQGADKNVIALVENGIKDIAGLNMEKEIIYFTRDNLGIMQRATLKFLEALKEHKLV